jgi:pimeloyl-ACP methyl ester carboxylesterase
VQWASRQKDPVRTTARLFQLCFTAMVGWEFAAPAALARLRTIAALAAEAATPASTLHEKLGLLWGQPPGLPGGGELPVSIIASPWDLAAPLSGARAWAARLPGSNLRVLSYTGHSGHYSRPRTFNRMVVEEMERLAKPTAPSR